jgi:exosortase/archaeosortase family protein
MITAIFVHLTQDKLWKKITIFVFSIVFAIVGNVGRIFTVILVAKFINPEWAAGIYHEYSGFVFFPIALLAMFLLSKLLNLHWPVHEGTQRPPGADGQSHTFGVFPGVQPDSSGGATGWVGSNAATDTMTMRLPEAASRAVAHDGAPEP